MIKNLPKLFLLIFLTTYCIFSSQNAVAQTPTFASLTGGLSGSNPTAGTSGQAYMGFSVSVSGGSITFNSFYFTASSSNITSFLANGTLYRSPTSTFNPASPGTPVGNVTFSGTNVTIDNFNETVGAGPNYYFLVADAINTSTHYEQLVVSYSSNWATDINGNNYQPKFSGNYGYSFQAATPYPLTISNQTTGLTSNTATIAPGTSALKVFSFSITNNSSSTYTFSAFNINSNTSSLGSTMNNFKLYSNTTDAFPGTGAIATTSTASGSYVNFSLSSETIAAGATKYYFLVCDAYSGGAAAAIQFNFQDGQSTSSIVASSPSSSYNTATAFGNTYNVNYANLVVTSLTGGTTSGTLTPLQTGVVLFGFSLTASSTISVSNFNINSTNTAATYFGNGVLYRCNNTNYASATSAVAVGTVTFSGSYANVVFSTPESITSSSTNQNYFLVADNIAVAATTGTTIAFNFISGQSQAAIIQTSPTSSYNTFAISGNTLTLSGPTFALTSENSTSNGITSGSLGYGQSGIVLFGVGIEALGTSLTMTGISFHDSGSENSYFSNYKLYRSTSPTFPGGTPLYTGGVGCNCGHIDFTSISETIPAGTTYYYFLTADFTVGTGTLPSTFQVYFSSGQSPVAITTSGSTYNTYNISGTSFNLATAENWIGTTSNFALATNFKATNGGSGFIPTSSTVVNIGGAGVSYTVAPVIGASTTIGGLIFGTTGAPTLTINSGQTLTINTSMQVNNSTVNITGPGTLTLGSSVVANTSASTTLNLSGGVTLNNAGTFNTGTSSTITLAGSSKLSNTGTFNLASTASIGSIANSTLANTGTFTLASDASGSATIGQLSGTGTVTGNYAAQRYITGGSSTYRGYRILTSPVSDPASTSYYNLSYLVGSGSYTSGAAGGGFDVSGNPSMFLYRDDITPNNAGLGVGNFRAITKINNSPAYGIGTVDGGTYNLPIGTGIFYFFRGNNGTLTTTVPNNITLSNTGPLNQGQVTYKYWYNGTAGVDYGSATGNSAVIGFNMAGNPYASSIDWNTVYGNNTTTSGICCATNLSYSIYVYNVTTKNYSIYTTTSSSGGTTSGSAGGSNILPSGQGFFVRATGTGAQLIFNETAKVTSQPSTLLLVSARGTTDRHIRLQLFKDTINKDETVVLFNPAATAAFNDHEDALYLQGNGLVNLSNMTSDNQAVGLNQEPFPKTTQSIKLNVLATNDDTYQLNATEVNNIPNLYDVWLKDAYLKDSVNLKTTPTYSFTVTHSDTTTFGSNRFSLVIRQNAAYIYKLLTFTGTKTLGGAQLNWTTQNEDTYTVFTLQRSTDGGKTFVTLTTINSTGAGAYSYLDTKPAVGNNQYRLQQTDLDGGNTYSNVVDLNYSNAAAGSTGNISIYPNPVANVLNVVIVSTNNAAATYSLIVTTSNGDLIKTYTSSQTTWQGNVSDLKPGLYIIKAVNNTDKSIAGITKFIKL